MKNYRNEKQTALEAKAHKLKLDTKDIIYDAEVMGESPFGPRHSFHAALFHEIGHLYLNHPLKIQYAPLVSWGLIGLIDLGLKKTILKDKIEKHPIISSLVKSAVAYIGTKLYNQYAEIQADNEVIKRIEKPEYLKEYAHALKSTYVVDKAHVKLNYPKFGKLLDSYPGLYQLINHDHPHPLWRAKRVYAAAQKLEKSQNKN